MLPHQDLLRSSKLHKYKPGDGTLTPMENSTMLGVFGGFLMVSKSETVNGHKCHKATWPQFLSNDQPSCLGDDPTVSLFHLIFALKIHMC